MDGEREEIDIASIFVCEVPTAAAIKVELLRRLWMQTDQYAYEIREKERQFINGVIAQRRITSTRAHHVLQFYKHNSTTSDNVLLLGGFRPSRRHN